MNKQIRGERFSRLRQQLLQLHHQPEPLLARFMEGRPLIKGTLYVLRRKCGKPSCRCAKGRRHETMAVSALVAGKTRLWTIAPERVAETRRRTERYRHFRRARAAFIDHQRRKLIRMLRLIDAIAQIRGREP
jgi:hypothetical protein